MSAAKFVVALLGAIAGITVEIAPILPERYQGIAQGIIAIATALGVYQVPNKEAPEEEPKPFFS